MSSIPIDSTFSYEALSQASSYGRSRRQVLRPTLPLPLHPSQVCGSPKTSLRDIILTNAPLTRPVFDPELLPVPEPFQTPSWRPPLSLAFRSGAQPAAPSASDWNDIDSALFQ